MHIYIPIITLQTHTLFYSQLNGFFPPSAVDHMRIHTHTYVRNDPYTVVALYRRLRTCSDMPSTGKNRHRRDSTSHSVTNIYIYITLWLRGVGQRSLLPRDDSSGRLSPRGGVVRNPDYYIFFCFFFSYFCIMCVCTHMIFTQHITASSRPLTENATSCALFQEIGT